MYLEDLVVIVEAFLVFNFRDNLDMASGMAEKSPAVFDVLCSSSKTERNEGDSILKGKLGDVLLVLLGKGGELDFATWEVHVLP